MHLFSCAITNLRAGSKHTIIMIKAIILEDELSGRENLQLFLKQYCKEVDVVAELSSIKEAQRFFDDERNRIDVAFLDINLSDGLVFKLLDNLEDIDFEIIFVTAYEEHAIRACQYSSIGYIMKPIDAVALQEAVSRIRPGNNNQINDRLSVMRQAYYNPNSFTKIAVSGLDGIHFVALTDIVRFEADNNYTYIFLNNGDKITVSKTIKVYENHLANANFYRVHKSHVINLNYMKRFVKGEGGYLVMEDDMRIEVSRRRRPAFLEKIKVLEGGML